MMIPTCNGTLLNESLKNKKISHLDVHVYHISETLTFETFFLKNGASILLSTVGYNILECIPSNVAVINSAVFMPSFIIDVPPVFLHHF